MGRRLHYIPLVVSFDIETTSYEDDGDKKAIVYSWCMSVAGDVTVYRTEHEWIDALNKLVADYHVSVDNRLVIWVHNLAFEFAFIAKSFHWDDVFAVGDVHRVTRAVTSQGIEFRCSYMLTHQSLAVVGKEVGVAKMTGDLDYSLMRHNETPLTEAEMGYIVSDVRVVDALIESRLSTPRGRAACDTLATIPMTSTGYVRRMVRENARKDDEYMSWLRSTPLTEVDYTFARRAFSGGYVHANAEFAGVTLGKTDAVDLGSSYPASMTQFRYPMSAFSDAHPESVAEMNAYTDHYPAFLDITLRNIEARYPFPPISESKTLVLRDEVLDNGRVHSASEVRIIITDVDWRVIRRAYSIESVSLHALRIAESGVLPDAIVGPVLQLYRSKTVFKGLDDRVDAYRAAKSDINSVYGMCAMDPVTPLCTFDPDTGAVSMVPVPLDEALHDHNVSWSRFLYYPWAAWITANSRSVLLNAIMDMFDAGVVPVYCDTDSIYHLASPAADAVVDASNRAITARMERAESLRNRSGRTAPYDPSGTPRPLGVFEFDGSHDNFKTLGAKRYALLDGDEFKITVSGLSKKAASYVQAHGGFDFFKPGMTIPAGESGRSVHTYSTASVDNVMQDYTGRYHKVHQDGFIHLAEAAYHMSVSGDYERFIKVVNKAYQS